MFMEILHRYFCCLLLAGLGLAPLSLRAGWLDLIWSKPTNQASGGSGLTSLTDLSQDQVAGGLKEALAQGVRHSITNLGRTGGYLSNVNVRIPIPEKLSGLEKTLRMLKQDHLVDEFVGTMNHAAEAAVPETGAIFADAITNLTVTDARTLLKGPDDAAIQYFKKIGGPRLQEKMLPVIQQATAQAGVTASYKKLMVHAGPASSLFNLSSSDLDLDRYVTQKAADGLFKVIAEEEKRIRQDPAARATDLLRRVFGAK
jgi:hypothetical protein